MDATFVDRWTPVIQRLQQASSGEEIVAACEPFAAVGWSEIEPLWDALLDDAAERDDARAFMERRNDADLARFTSEHGIAALSDQLVVSFPDELAASISRLEAAADHDGEARAAALRHLLSEPAMARASKAFRRRVLVELANVLSERQSGRDDPGAGDEAAELLARVVDLTPSFLIEERGRALNKLAIVRMKEFDRTGERAALDRAIEHLHAALGQFESWPSAGLAAGNLAVALRKRAEVTESLADVNAAIDLLGGSQPSPDGLHNLANALRLRYGLTGDLADLDRAIDFEKLAVQQTAPDSTERLRCLLGLGDALVRRNAVRRNASDLSAAVEVLEVAFTAAPPGPLQRRAAGSLADALAARFAYRDELSDLKNLLHLGEQLVSATQPDTVERAHALLSLGRALLLQHRRRPDDAIAARAEVLFREVIAAARSPRLAAAAWRSLSDLAMLGADGETAAVEASRRMVREAAEAVTTPEDVVSLYERWAALAATASSWDEATSAASRALAAAELLADAQLDRKRLLLALRTNQGLAVLAAHGAARSGQPERAIELLERGRARLLGRSPAVARRQLARLPQAHAEIATRYLVLEDQVAAAEAGLVVGTAIMGSTVKDLMDLRARRVVLEDRLRELRRARSEVVAAVRALPGMTDFLAPCQFEEVRARVEASGIPAVYVFATRREGCALIVRAGAVETIWLPLTSSDVSALLIERKSWDELTPDERMEWHEDQLHSIQFGSVDAVVHAEMTPSAFGDWTDRLPRKAGARGGLLAGQLGWVPLEQAVQQVVSKLEVGLAPLADVLPPAVVLVPCGELALLPLHAAMRGTTVRYAVSVASMAPRPSDRRLAGTVRVIGDPAPVTHQLPWAREEATMVAAAVKTSEVLVAEEATRERVVADLDRVAALHLACHGEYDSHDPLASRLLLAQGTSLTAGEILSLSLGHMQMTALSACRSATADTAHLPDEALGLTSAFLGAGVPSVIGTLWQVDDRAAAILMSRFYERYTAGAEPADALHAATRWLASLPPEELAGEVARRSVGRDLGGGAAADNDVVSDLASPANWAPFVLYGW